MKKRSEERGARSEKKFSIFFSLLTSLSPVASAKGDRSSPLLHGQTMIEFMVAMTVIIIGLISAASLAFSNVRTQEISADHILASNFAREGVELARSIRDTNWLAGLPFNTGLNNGTDYSGSPQYTATGVFNGFDFSPSNIDSNNATLIKMSTAGGGSSGALYVQGTGVAGTNTVFKRMLLLQPICMDNSGSPITYNTPADGSLCPGSQPTVGVRVTSTVVWDRRGVRRSSVIVDDMYDWR
ncbi:MAG: hypothetical protein WC477_00635 [Patescibacteria group bacterium]